MPSKAHLLLGALSALASAAPGCRPPFPTPTLPSTGGVTELPGPPSGTTLKHIAIGHGIQNYTCAAATTNATAAAIGALAVLYDITPFYPGTRATGLSAATFWSLPSTVLQTQALPLNLQDASAALPGGPALPETRYAAATADPFPAAPVPPLALPTDGRRPALFLGHHYFDASGAPTFALRGGLFAREGDKVSALAPEGADAGILGTGAVSWLRLVDDGSGASQGIAAVYRVQTAGGAAQTCDESGVGEGSVPYTAMYWFYAQD